MRETYRFWSTDPLYLEITKRITEEHGVRVKKDDFRELWLYHGTNYEFGKAHGRAFPAGVNPHNPNGKVCYPATLEIITESSDRLPHLEHEWEIGEDIPRESQRKLNPSDDWDARVVNKK